MDVKGEVLLQPFNNGR